MTRVSWNLTPFLFSLHGSLTHLSESFRFPFSHLLFLVIFFLFVFFFFLVSLFFFLIHHLGSDDKSQNMPLPKIFAPKNDRGKNQSFNQAPAVARSAYSANQASVVAGAGYAYSACHAKCAYDAKKLSGKKKLPRTPGRYLSSPPLFILEQFQYVTPFSTRWTWRYKSSQSDDYLVGRSVCPITNWGTELNIFTLLFFRPDFHFPRGMSIFWFSFVFSCGHATL